MKRTAELRSWVILGLGLFSLIIVPFVVFEEVINREIGSLLSEEFNRLLLSSLIIFILSADIFLPIPSSVVGTASGAMLGPLTGTLVTWLGLSLGCLLAYGFGMLAGRFAIRRVAGEEELDKTGMMAQKHGDWVVVLFRAVPVLAESSVIWAGASRMPLKRYLMMTSLANFGVAAVYSNVGALVTGSISFLVAFVAALLLPGLAMLLSGRWFGRQT